MTSSSRLRWLCSVVFLLVFCCPCGADGERRTPGGQGLSRGCGASAAVRQAPGDAREVAVQGSEMDGRRADEAERTDDRRRGAPVAARDHLRRRRAGRRVEVDRRRRDVDGDLRELPHGIHRRPGDRAVGPEDRVGRHRRSQHLPEFDGRHRDLQVGRRGPALHLHGARRHAAHLAHPRAPDQPGHRLRGLRRPRVHVQPRPRRLQDDRRREDVAEGVLQERAHRRDRPGDGPVRPERPLRRHGAAAAVSLERPDREHRERPLQDDGRREDVDGADERPAGLLEGRVRADRHQRRQGESRTSSTWSSTSSRRRERSRAPTCIAATTRAGASSWSRGTRRSGRRSRTAGSSARFASTRATRTSST